MPHQINNDEAREILRKAFEVAEEQYNGKAALALPKKIIASTDRLFRSVTQAYREALVGCAIARIVNQEIDIRRPATADGENAFSGRSLADNAVTPFLRERAIPISASPYLSSLRGGAKFTKGGEPRIQRDQGGFDALVSVVDYLRVLPVDDATEYLQFLLRRFIELRESASIPLKKIAKPNLEQLSKLIEGLLTVKSGGRIPAILATALFQTISECHALGWDVEFQGINVADKLSGAVGDITIRKSGTIILGIEVTERPVDQARVTLTFNQKISPGGLSDYLFITTAKPEKEAMDAARSYTGVGHEVNFVPLAPLLHLNLATLGPACRALFQAKVIDLIDAQTTAADLRVAWNSKMDDALGVKSRP